MKKSNRKITKEKIFNEWLKLVKGYNDLKNNHTFVLTLKLIIALLKVIYLILKMM